MRDYLPNALDNAVKIVNQRANINSTNLLINDVERDIQEVLLNQLKNIISKDDILHELNIDPSDIIAISQHLSDKKQDEQEVDQSKKISDFKKRKNKKKKEKTKIRKSQNNKNEVQIKNNTSKEPNDESQKTDENQIIEYYQEKDMFNPLDKEFAHMMNVYNTFKLNSDIIVDKSNNDNKSHEIDNSNDDRISYQQLALKPRGYVIEDEDLNENLDFDTKIGKMTKKQKKNQHRMSCAQLKYFVNRPDIVEMHDGNSPDPLLLIHLKSLRNTVPVPQHWSYKRRYLSTQREHNKGFFELPDFIKATGIQEIREALQSQEASKSLKAKMRGHVRPKTGKYDIDYQKLHDAFFKNQTKPFMTTHGDLYYEGKEFKTKMQKKQPGILSNELRIALGMPIGPEAHKCPPPWLIAQQRYGPPPSYPGLKIPGLNHPIPETCQFGYHAGGWGKPPVNENGKPLYGDVFGIGQDHVQQLVNPPLPEDSVNFDIDEIWGDFMSSDESFMDEADNRQDEAVIDDNDDVSVKGILTPSEGIVTPSGTYSSQSSLSHIELSKAGVSEEKYDKFNSHPLYTVIPEKKVSVESDQFIGTSHIYDLSSIVKSDRHANDNETMSDQVGSHNKLHTRVQKSNAIDNKSDRKHQNDDEDDDLTNLNKKKFKF